MLLQIKSNFTRLFLGKGIWLYLVLSLIIPFTVYRSFISSGFGNGLAMLGQHFLYGTAMQAVFCALFFGREEQAKAFQNKIIVGTKRLSIFFADLITTLIIATVSFAIHAGVIYILFQTGIGREGIRDMYQYRLYERCLTGKGFYMTLIAILLWLICFTVVFTVLNLFSSSRVFVLFFSAFFIFVSVYLPDQIRQRLENPEYIAVEDETTHVKETVPNPGYISGSMRDVFTYYVESSPLGFIGYELDGRSLKTEKIAEVTLSVCVLTSAIGAISFAGKEFD